MGFDSKVHHRKSIRLRGYDYSQAGAYFVTLCTHNRKCLFGDIIEGQMKLNPLGKMADDEWRKTNTMRPNIQINEYVIMPNHTHCIMQFVGAHCMRPVDQTHPVEFATPKSESIQHKHGHGVSADQGRMQRAPTVGDVVRGYKAAVTSRVNESNNTSGVRVWQRNYHEHIIRNENAYDNLANYIQTNPERWQEDTYHV